MEYKTTGQKYKQKTCRHGITAKKKQSLARIFRRGAPAQPVGTHPQLFMVAIPGLVWIQNYSCFCNGRALLRLNVRSPPGSVELMHSSDKAKRDLFMKVRRFLYGCSAWVSFCGLMVPVAWSEGPGQAPSILAQPQSATVYPLQSVTFSVVAAGTPPLFYQWRYNGADLANATQATLGLFCYTNFSGNYSVIVSNAYGSTTSDVATLIVKPAYGFIVFNNCVSYQVQAPVYGPEPGNPTQAKQGNPTNGFPAGSQSYGGTRLLGANYTAQLWAAPFGSSESDLQPCVQAVTTFRTGPTPGWLLHLSLEPRVDGVFPGERALLQLRVWDNQGGTVTTWDGLLANTNILRGKSATFVSLPLGGGIAVPPNLVGLTSFNIHLPGPDEDSPPSIVTQPQDQTVGLGGVAILSAVVSGSSPCYYQWKFQNNDIPGGTNATLILVNTPWSAAGPYSVAVSNQFGLTASSNAVLVVVDNPGLILFNNTISQQVVAPVYSFEPADTRVPKTGNTSSGYPPGTQIYGGSKLLGPGFTAQLWAGPVGSREEELLPVQNALSPFRSSGAGGNFQFIPQNCAVHGVPPQVRAVAQLRAWSNRGGAVTNWEAVLADPTIPRGVSMLFITPPLGGVSSDGLQVVPPAPLSGLTSFNLYTLVPTALILSQPQSQSVVCGSNALFSVVATGAEPLFYQWRFNGIDLAAANAPTLALGNVWFEWAGNYTVLVTNQFGGELSAKAILTVGTPPVAIAPLDPQVKVSQIKVTGEAGSVSVIESTTNFVDWVPLTVVTNFSGSLYYFATNDFSSDHRFFRTHLLR